MTTEWLTMALDDIVQKYSVELREILKSQKEKMKKFIEHDCIEYIGHDKWNVLPIPNYNKNTYRVVFDGEWDCNCQWRTLNGLKCSHIGAVQMWLMRKGNKL